MASVNVEVGMTGASKFQTDVTKSGDALAYLRDVANGAASSLDTFNSALDTVTKDQERQKNLTALATSTAEIAKGIQAQVEAAIKVANAFFGAAEETAKYGDEIDKQSQKLGISRRAYQEWNYVLERSGGSIESVASAMKQLAKIQTGQTKTAAESLEAVGLSLESVQGMAPEDLFYAVITGLQQIEDYSQRTVIAEKLLGRSYQSLSTLLSMDSAELAALFNRFEELGGYMSDEAIDASAEYQDSITDINVKLEAFKRNVFSQFLPALTELRNNIIDNGSLDRLADGIASLATHGVSLLTWLVDHSDAAVTAVEAIGAAFLTWKGIETVSTLVKNVQQLYSWLNLLGTVLGIGTGAAAGGVAAAGVGIVAVVDHAAEVFGGEIGTIGSGHNLQEYTENVAALEAELYRLATVRDDVNQNQFWSDMDEDAYAMAMVRLMNAQAELARAQAAAGTTDQSADVLDIAQTAETASGNVAAAAEDSAATITTATGEMLQAVDATAGEIRDDWATGLDGMSETAANEMIAANNAMAQNAEILSANASVWGQDMMISFANGIITGANAWVRPSIDEIAAAINARLGFSEPEVGPLSDFHTWAPDMMRLFASGIRNNIPLLDDAVTEAFDFRGLIEDGARGATTNFGGITLNVYTQGEVNADVLYREFTYRLQHDVMSREAVFAH